MKEKFIVVPLYCVLLLSSPPHLLCGETQNQTLTHYTPFIHRTHREVPYDGLETTLPSRHPVTGTQMTCCYRSLYDTMYL